MTRRDRATVTALALKRGICALARGLPVGPVALTIGPARGVHGWAEVIGRQRRVHISHRAGHKSALDTLAHEWAHLAHWRRRGSAEHRPHGPEWRELYQRARGILSALS